MRPHGPGTQSYIAIDSRMELSNSEVLAWTLYNDGVFGLGALRARIQVAATSVRGSNGEDSGNGIASPGAAGGGRMVFL